MTGLAALMVGTVTLASVFRVFLPKVGAYSNAAEILVTDGNSQSVQSNFDYVHVHKKVL